MEMTLPAIAALLAALDVVQSRAPFKRSAGREGEDQHPDDEPDPGEQKPVTKEAAEIHAGNTGYWGRCRKYGRV